ncbi:hypothetical protein BD309DRAFT_1015913 [Dichomitus squalens]|uniref:Uncharacterized protein n=1 Tax=Dichomitus squalens TaxID=114155 RepID=A0A4Q9P5V1_9APHY|nr:hypothetical protein BD309DRAFT_1015913 [Dichomitus squalens]TBU59378.1 hypothetical protein BD310DRAFT_817408 [Dichomitus squalens]
MAPKRRTDTEDTIDKRRARRPQVILRTLPPIIFSTPNNALTFQLTMSVPGVKPSSSTTSPIDTRPSSLEQTFGINTHKMYEDSQVVEREFQRVKTDLTTKSQTLDEKITGLETRLTAKIDAQKAYVDEKLGATKTYVDGKFKKQEEQLSQMQLNLDLRLDDHFDIVDNFSKKTEQWCNKHAELVDGNFRAVDKRFDEMQKNVDERFSKVDERFDALEKRFDGLQDLLQRLLIQGGASPTSFTPQSSQEPLPPLSLPTVTVSAPSSPVAGPSSARSRSRPPSTTTRDAASIRSGEQRPDPVGSVLRSIKRLASIGIMRNKERLEQ